MYFKSRYHTYVANFSNDSFMAWNSSFSQWKSMKELPQVFVCGKQKLSVVIEGRPPVYFRFNKGHPRKYCEVGTNEQVIEI